MHAATLTSAELGGGLFCIGLHATTQRTEQHSQRAKEMTIMERTLYAPSLCRRAMCGKKQTAMALRHRLTTSVSPVFSSLRHAHACTNSGAAGTKPIRKTARIGAKPLQCQSQVKLKSATHLTSECSEPASSATAIALTAAASALPAAPAPAAMASALAPSLRPSLSLCPSLDSWW